MRCNRALLLVYLLCSRLVADQYWPMPWLEGAWAHLHRARLAQRIPHALLFSGPAGVGKKQLALRFSKALLCQSGDEVACGHCDACVQFDNGSHPDYRFLAPDEKSGNFKIETIRALGQDLALTSQYGGYRIAVLDGVDGFTEGAANALLKTLEEPPPGVVLLLLTPWPGRLMATIRSRCQQVRCGAPETSAAVEWLAAQGVAEPMLALQQANGAPLFAALQGEEGGELPRLLGEVLPKLCAGKLSVAAASKMLGDHQARDVAAAMLSSLDMAAIDHSADLANGLEIACFGGRRPANAVFTLRQRIIDEHRLDPTGLNQQAAIERLMMWAVRP